MKIVINQSFRKSDYLCTEKYLTCAFPPIPMREEIGIYPVGTFYSLRVVEEEGAKGNVKMDLSKGEILHDF